MPEKITVALTIDAEPALQAVRRLADAVRDATAALDDLSCAISQIGAGAEEPAPDRPAALALRVVEVHRPVNGEPLFNVLDPDGKRVNQRPLPRSEADALARNPN